MVQRASKLLKPYTCRNKEQVLKLKDWPVRALKLYSNCSSTIVSVNLALCEAVFFVSLCIKQLHIAEHAELEF